MRRISVLRLSGVVLAAALAGGALTLLDAQSAGQPRRARLLVSLPEFAVTPDGMALAADGSLVVACPNFAAYGKGEAKPSVPACLLKVGKDLKVRKWFETPILAETGRSCPMGIEFGDHGELYVVDNQNWSAGNGPDGETNQGRVLRLRIDGDRIVQTTVIAKGISHPNGVRYRNGRIYVTVSMLPKVRRDDGLMVSAVYCFPRDAQNIQVGNTLKDANLLASFVTENRFAPYGADGLAFGPNGDLYVGNFGDGKIHRIVLGTDGHVTENSIFARTDHDYSLDPKLPGFLAAAVKAKMRSTDGICAGPRGDLYVADFSNNAVVHVSPAGSISVLAQNPDTGGQNGDLNQPGEPILWNGRLVVSNFDAVVAPDKVNRKHESPATLSVLSLN